MAFNVYNPYQQIGYQMGQYQQPQTQQPQNCGLNWVQGESGAKSWIVGRGETVLLMDSEEQVFYIKSSDNAGMPLPLRVFDYTERTVAPNNAPNITGGEFVTRDEYNALSGKYEELRQMIEGIKKGDAKNE